MQFTRILSLANSSAADLGTLMTPRMGSVELKIPWTATSVRVQVQPRRHVARYSKNSSKPAPSSRALTALPWHAFI